MGVLSNIVIAITGTLPAEPKDIKKWVDANGGKYSGRVNKSVTHLVASKDAWRRAEDPVIQAAELGCQIVSYDWLEDSLHKRRKLAEKKYTFEAIKKEKKRQRKIQKMGIKADSKSKHLLREPKPSKSFFFSTPTPYVSATDALKQRRAEREAAEAAEKAAKAAKKALSSGTAQAPIEIEDDESRATYAMPTPPASVSPINMASPSPSAPVPTSSVVNGPQAKRDGLKDTHHYYLDMTGFEYKVRLSKNNLAQNQITRYDLSILESHAAPHTYCTHVRYVPPPPGSVTGDKPKISDEKVRNSLLKFLDYPDPESAKPSESMHMPTMNHTLLDPNEADRLRALIAPRVEPPVDRNKLAQLQFLITPAAPSPSLPYTDVVCPMNSTFHAAWRAFRHVFRDLTLLSWEERFDFDKVIQKSRAQALTIEPYIYSKPPTGVPIGLQVQEHGLYHGFPSDIFIGGDAEDGYVRNEFNLPGTDEPLSRRGIVGNLIWLDEEKIRREEESRLEKIEEKERKEREATRTKKSAEHRKPIFNGDMGKPQDYESVQARSSDAAKPSSNKPWPSYEY